MSLVEEWGLWSGDEQVFDDDGSDDDVVIELSPSTPAGTSSTEVPSASTSMLVILAGLLALAAVRRSGAIR
ncbi:MAG: hypothetical protein ACTHK2_02360 [Dokdonella sp.]|uniref:hypothetical protein n=1 Tax=Dokdonella sp. TaxID=2291710 RepID=UPI003F7DEF55